MATDHESLIVFLLLYCGHVSFAAHSLYSPNDPIVELDNSNFQETIVGSDTAWVVEFYSAWCGHCQRFAPIYKEYARDVEEWSKVIRVAVVACSDPKNNPVCASQNIRGFPTVKFYPANLRSATRSYKLQSLRFNADSVRSATLRFVEQYVSESSTAPSLKQYRSISELRRSVPRNPRQLLAIIEDDRVPSDTELAKSVILDVSSSRPDLVVGRLPRSALPDPSSLWQPLPALVQVDPHRDTIRHIAPVHSRETTVQAISRLAGGGTSNHHDIHQGHRTQQYIGRHVPAQSASQRSTRLTTTTEHPSATSSPSTHGTSSMYGLHQEDLDSNLYYLLWNEVSSRTSIRGNALPALKEYIRVLHKYHPGNERLKSFLEILYKWFQRIGGSLDSRLYLNTIEGLQTNDSYIEKHLTWQTCQGSSGQFRGYPCSLWMTFHALTVGAYEEHLQNPTASFDPLEVMKAIRGYVKYFFSCEDCRDHFLEMSKHITREISRPQDGILWLWKGHNKVNNRLHGDQTEDPQHLKQQFPSKVSCPNCRYNNHLPNDRFENDTNWDEVETLEYLRGFYSPLADSPQTSHSSSDEDHEHTPPAKSVTTSRKPSRNTENTSEHIALPHRGTYTNTRSSQQCSTKATTWSDCSVSCGVGVSIRLTNNNEDCEMRLDTRMCQLRRCDVDYGTLLRRRNIHHCSTRAANLQEGGQVKLSFNNCSTNTSYKWRYCGVCPGYCCDPVSDATFWADITCNGQHGGKAQIMWIERCQCRRC